MSSTIIRSWPTKIIKNKFLRPLLKMRFFRMLFAFIYAKYIIYEINGCKYYCNLLDYRGVVHYFLKNNHYEPYITKMVLQYAANGGDFLDIGANIGYFSILYSRHSQNKVYAIEPEPTNYRDLAENIRLNECQHIRSFNCAVGETNEKINFYVNSKNKGDHRCSRFEDNLSEVIRVDIKRMDHILTKEEFDRIRLIKIDVQGYELKVCRGMENYLRQARDLRIISELEPDSMSLAGDTPQEYLNLLTGFGFRTSIIDEQKNNLIPATVEQILDWSRKTSVTSILFEK